jgi:hypothetical protein
MDEPHDWQAHLAEVRKILESHGYHPAAWEVRDAAAEIARLRAHVGDLEAENARLLGMIDRMAAAANELVSAARSHCPKDRRFSSAWKRMRGAIPVQIVGSEAGDQP